MLKTIVLSLAITFLMSAKALCPTKIISENKLKFDKIEYQSINNSRGGRRPPNYLLLDPDKKIIFMTFPLSRSSSRYSKCDITQTNEGIANDKIFNQIVELSNQIDFDNIRPKDLPIRNGSYHGSGWDRISFFKNGVLYKSVSTGTHKYSDELRSLQALLNRLIKETEFSSFQSNTTFQKQRLSFISFQKLKIESAIETETKAVNKKGFNTSVNFLLWYYLSTAEEIKDPNFQPKMLYEFYYPPLEICLDYRPAEGNMNINGKWQVVKRGETDGRYFRFISESGESVILDIGVNFFTHTVKNEYEKWILEQN